LGGWAVLLDIGDEDAGAVGEFVLVDETTGDGDVLAGDADPAAAHAAVLEELRDDEFCGVDSDGEAEALRGHDGGGVDADDLAARVDERTAGVAGVEGGVGLDAFTDAAVHDREVLALASKVNYVIDPDNPYPDDFTGHIRAVMTDGQVFEERQPHFRGGAKEPLTRADIEEKFTLNVRHGGWDAKQSATALKLLGKLYKGEIDIAPLRG